MDLDSGQAFKKAAGMIKIIAFLMPLSACSKILSFAFQALYAFGSMSALSCLDEPAQEKMHTDPASKRMANEASRISTLREVSNEPPQFVLRKLLIASYLAAPISTSLTPSSHKIQLGTEQDFRLHCLAEPDPAASPSRASSFRRLFTYGLLEEAISSSSLWSLSKRSLRGPS
jgi:hypothetical protein